MPEARGHTGQRTTSWEQSPPFCSLLATGTTLYLTLYFRPGRGRRRARQGAWVVFDRVLVTVRVRGRGKDSSVTVNQRPWHLLELRDGRLSLAASVSPRNGSPEGRRGE